jgi:threonine synthase
VELVNLKDASEQVTFAEAVKKGLGKNQGLFFPKQLPKFDDIESILAMPFVERSVEILSTLIGDELPREMVAGIVERAFVFGATLVVVLWPSV